MIITNAPDPIWLWHQRVAQLIPPLSSPYTGIVNASYTEQLQELRAATACREARVVFFFRPNRKPARTIPHEVVSELGLKERIRFADGVVYEVDEPCP
jgi:hypothetical protein